MISDYFDYIQLLISNDCDFFTSPVTTSSLFPSQTPHKHGERDGCAINFDPICSDSAKKSVREQVESLIRDHDDHHYDEHLASRCLLGSSLTTGTCIYETTTGSGSPPEPKGLVNENNAVFEFHYLPQQIMEDALQNGKEKDLDGADQSNTIVSSIDKTRIIETSPREHITSKISFSLEVLKQHFGMKIEDAANTLGISRSSFKRVCRENGIERWPSHKRKKINRHPSNLKKVNNKRVQVSEEQNKEYNVRDCFNSPPKQAAVVADTVPHATPLRDASSSVTIKATYEDDIIKFQLPFSTGMDDLREKVAKRLNLEVGTFKLKHKDDAGDLVLINCDEDLKDCMCRCRSLDKATIDMLVLLISYQSK